ncbi:hypothetical protein MRX96_000639 [Rhipicephalus microplus]
MGLSWSPLFSPGRVLEGSYFKSGVAVAITAELRRLPPSSTIPLLLEFVAPFMSRLCYAAALLLVSLAPRRVAVPRLHSERRMLRRSMVLLVLRQLASPSSDVLRAVSDAGLASPTHLRAMMCSLLARLSRASTRGSWYDVRFRCYNDKPG